MLALSAAIEAARAGEHGCGFTVVSGEGRKLADSARHYADKISQILLSIRSQIEHEYTVMADEMIHIAATTEQNMASVQEVHDSMDTQNAKIHFIVDEYAKLDQLLVELKLIVGADNRK